MNRNPFPDVGRAPAPTSTRVENADKSAVQWPPEFQDRRIPPSISVKALLAYLTFVTQGDANEGEDWRGLLSAEEPNTSLEGLFQVCVLPPKAVLEKLLEKTVGIQAKSVIDWSYKDTGKEVRYSPTALAIYRDFARANKTRMLWRQAEDWMARWTGQTKGLEDAAQLAGRLICTLEWDTYVRAAGTSIPTNELLSVLDDAWMSDNQIDMILQVLTERLGSFAQGDETIIAPCIFIQHIRNVFQMRNTRKPLTALLLERYRAAFLNGTKKNLFFIALVGGNHFVVWKIDHTVAALSHGDSLGVGEKKLDEIKTCIFWWMSTLYTKERKCTYLGNQIEHGDQTRGDGFSCGIIACNAIAHELFGDELWDMKNRRRLRVEAFNSVILHHNQRRARKNPCEMKVVLDEIDDDLEVKVVSGPALPRSTSQEDKRADEMSSSKSVLGVFRGDGGMDKLGSDYSSGPPTSVAPTRTSSPTNSILCIDEQTYSKTLQNATNGKIAVAHESDVILTFSQIQEYNAHKGRDISRYPAVNELYDTRNGLQNGSKDKNTGALESDVISENSQSEQEIEARGECDISRYSAVNELHDKASELRDDAQGGMRGNQEGSASLKRTREAHEPPGKPGKKSKHTTIGPLDMFLRRRDTSSNGITGDTVKRTEVPTGVSQDADQSMGGESEGHDEQSNEEYVSRTGAFWTQEIMGLVVGQSRSAQHVRKMREARLSGTQTLNENLYERKVRIPCLEYDPLAQFDPRNWRVKHSKCRAWVILKSLYQSGYFIDHAVSCEGAEKIDDYFIRVQTNATSSSLPQKFFGKPRSTPVTRSCTGLTAIHDERIDIYLRRPTALGGGGKPPHELALEKYGKLYSKLSKAKKKEIDRLHEASWTWVVKNRHQAVFSAACEKTITVPDSYSGKDLSCNHCKALLYLKTFRNAISRAEPELENMKFVPLAYQHSEISRKFLKIKGVAGLIDPKDEQTSIAVCYAIGVANGEFADHVVFTGLVETVLHRMEREAKGLKMTNFKYPPAFDEFITTVHMVCPRAYRLLKDHFPVRSDRSIRKRNGRDGQFVAGISERSFERAARYVKALNVPGNHVALSADDTKLFATFHPFLDREEDKWYIVGGAGEQFLVNNPEGMRDELEKAELQKATKVRIWVLIVPLPKVPPIVLAALAITEKVSSEELFSYTMQIIDGLYKYEIWPISYACDGTEKERANQRRVREEAHSSDTRRVHAPSSSAPVLDIHIPVFHGKPMALIQDSLHARKTGRNNIQSGTKTMVLGDYPVLYRHLRDMAFHENSPVYHRDVEKADKQDDRAAARIFSADALEWLLDNGDDYFGTAIFLFVYGELIDAVQNRTLMHHERVRMVLRAYYFNNMWNEFIQTTGYTRSKSCLSREALDINSMLVTGFFETLFVYRDSFDGSAVPLLPWLHSSEPCEHVFGECRKLVKDFDFASFLHMMPKIHSMLHYALQFSSPSTEDSRGRAQGYIHTWMDLEGISLSNLAKYPTDDEINELAKLAFEDAEELWMQLEVFPEDIRPSVRKLPSNDRTNDMDGMLPSISFWNHDEASKRPSTPDTSSDDSDDENKAYHKEGQDEEDDSTDGKEETSLSILESERIALERLFEQEQETDAKGSIRLNHVDSTMLNLSCAKLFLDFDTDIQIDEMYEPTQETFDQWVSTYASEVGRILADSLPLVFESPEPQQKSHRSVRLSKEDLLETRRAHQSKLEQKAVRFNVQAASASDSKKASTSRDSKDEEKRARRLLIEKMNEFLNGQQDVAKSSGADRRLRWTGGSSGNGSGNAANAAAIAESKAVGLLSKRTRIYSDFPIPCKTCQMLSNAGVNSTYPLSNGIFIIIYFKKRLYIAEVLSLFMRGGGTYANHNYTAEVNKITQLSYISVQAYEQTSGPLFRAKTSATRGLQIRYFPHITSSEILFVLPDKPTERRRKTVLELSRLSFDIWSHIQSLSHILPDAMKLLKSRKVGP